jgi:hypothetical protein
MLAAKPAELLVVAADEIRAGDKSENRQADRIDDTTQRIGAGDQGDSMKVVGNQWSVNSKAIAEKMSARRITLVCF